MLTKLALPGLLIAFAACPPPSAQLTAPPQTVVNCGPSNDVLFEIISETRVDPPVRSITTVYATGTWEVTESTPTRRGCMLAADVARIEADVAAASWEITHDQLRCGAVAPLSVSYSAHGRALWTEEVCSGLHLDDDSKDRLERIIAIVVAATKKP